MEASSQPYLRAVILKPVSSLSMECVALQRIVVHLVIPLDTQQALVEDLRLGHVLALAVEDLQVVILPMLLVLQRAAG